MRAATGERVEIERQRRDQRLAFAGGHFRDPAAVQHDSADQLHIEVHHVPGHRLIADREALLPLRQAARGVFHHRKCFRQNLVELRPLLLQIWNLARAPPSRPRSSRAARRRRAP